jgi:hypothetical protein
MTCPQRQLNRVTDHDVLRTAAYDVGRSAGSASLLLQTRLPHQTPQKLQASKQRHSLRSRHFQTPRLTRPTSRSLHPTQVGYRSLVNAEAPYPSGPVRIVTSRFRLQRPLHRAIVLASSPPRKRVLRPSSALLRTTSISPCAIVSARFEISASVNFPRSTVLRIALRDALALDLLLHLGCGR